jgi:uncharacterized protein (DUF983 family)
MPAPSESSRLEGVVHALRLRCPRCGGGRLYRSLTQMARKCGGCGLDYRREAGFYLGSIYINYGITVIVTGLLYAAVTLLGWSHRLALIISLVVAALLPVLLFRYARALLLALDSSVNRHQGTDATPAASSGSGLTPAHLQQLRDDDGRAGMMMGGALVAVFLFGLLMAGATLLFLGSFEGLSAGYDPVDLN